MNAPQGLLVIQGMTGAVVATIATSAPEGWRMMNGDTIGDASSAATSASADNEVLFKLLWASFADAQAPVVTGRGASAAADWTAHKKITLPDLRGRAVIGTGTGSGLTARTHGAGVGTETHTLTEAQMPLHGHPFETGSSTASTTGVGGILTGPNTLVAQVAYTGAVSNAAGQQIGGTGGGGSHPNVQPSLALNYMIKA